MTTKNYMAPNHLLVLKEVVRQCDPTPTTIANELGIWRTTVLYHLRVLEDKFHVRFAEEGAKRIDTYAIIDAGVFDLSHSFFTEN